MVRPVTEMSLRGNKCSGGGMKICVVDDVISMRKALRRVFAAQKGVTVYDFAGAPETIEFLKKNHVDVVVCDMYLQKGSGFDIVRHIRSRPILSDIPVIFVTGEGTKDDIVSAIDNGVTSYVLKPFETAELLSKVTAASEKFQNPSRLEQIVREAEAALVNGDLEIADAKFQEASDLGVKDSPRVAVGLAKLHFLRGEEAQGFKRLRHVITENPLYFPAFNMMVDALLQLGRKEEATAFLRKELEINGKQSHRRMLLADLLVETGHAEEALGQVRQAIVDHPKDERLLLKMAEIYRELSDSEKALHYYLKTRRLVRHSKQALEGILDVCSYAGHLKKAVQLFTDQLNADRSATDALVFRARAHELMGDFEAALGDIETYFLTAEPDADCLRLKARYLGKLGRSSEQIEVLVQLCEIEESPDNEARAGLAYLKAERFALAANHYARAVKLSPNTVKYRYNLAFALEKTGQFDRAKAMLQTVLKLDPGHDEARSYLKRLSA